MEQILSFEVLGNPVSRYLICAIIIAVGIIFIKILDKIIINRLKTFGEKKKLPIIFFIIRTLKKTIFPLFYYVVFIAAINPLEFPEIVDQAVKVIGVLFLTIEVIKFINDLIEYLFEEFSGSSKVNNSQIKGLKGLISIIKVFIWLFGALFVMQNLGFDVTTAVAGLGLTGLAFAFAAQKILEDLFSYLSILFDKPFEIGDFITVDDLSGTIEHIGMKTTRLKSLSGEQLIISNSDLTGSRLKNYKRMQRRRVVFKFGLTYDTTKEILEKIPCIMKGIIEKKENVTFDRAHFTSYGDFSLNFEIAYYVESAEYIKYLDVQQYINLEMKEIFENSGIEFAFPTQTILTTLKSKAE